MSDEMKEALETAKFLEDTFKCRVLMEIKNLETKKIEFAYFINNRTAFVVLKDMNSDVAVRYGMEEFFKKYKILGAYFGFEVEVKSKS